MVTLKKLKALAPFCKIVGDETRGWRATSAVTHALESAARNFAVKWWGLWPIDCFVVMPDHIHLLIRIKDTGDQMALGSIVNHLMRAFARAYWAALSASRGMPEPNTSRASGGGASCSGGPVRHIFEKDWHDWIVLKRGQLAAFTRYIRENPKRAWLRQANRQFFGKVNEIDFLGRKWFLYGNAAILNLPVLKPFKCSRKLVEGDERWLGFLAEAERRQPSNAELYARCHEMGDLVVEGLGNENNIEYDKHQII